VQEKKDEASHDKIIENLGLIQYINLDINYDLAYSIGKEGYLLLLSKIDSLMYQIKKVILLSYIGSEKFEEDKDLLKLALDNLIKSHEEINKENKKENNGKIN
jgi:hypothetical protein